LAAAEVLSQLITLTLTRFIMLTHVPVFDIIIIHLRVHSQSINFQYILKIRKKLGGNKYVLYS
jgi:hypothetical protein